MMRAGMVAFVIGSVLLMLGVLASLVGWVWSGDGRWGWTALICLGVAFLCVFFAAGFASADEKADKTRVFKDIG